MTPRTDTERGSGLIAAIIVLTAVLVVAAAGTMIDGGRFLATRRHVSTIAYETARAGAQAVATDSFHDPNAVLDPAAADTAARNAFGALAAGTGASIVTVTVTATDVRVTVNEAVSPWFPLLSPSTVSATGRARIASAP